MIVVSSMEQTKALYAIQLNGGEYLSSVFEPISFHGNLGLAQLYRVEQIAQDVANQLAAYEYGTLEVVRVN